MAFLYFTGLNPEGELEDYFAGATAIETSFEILTYLIRKGFQLKSVRLVDGTDSPTTLPVEAFDDHSLQEPIQELQQEWEELLDTNRNSS